MNPVRIGILGLGTVGTGTLTVLERNAEEISRRTGCPIVVRKAAVKHLSKSRAPIVDRIELTDNPWQVVESADIDIVVELIGGEQPAYDYVAGALQNGKHVVTANKELIAVRGNELFEFAQRQSLVIGFEAAVGGGISIIKAIREGLAGNRIQSLVGIINGTSNYILTGMKEMQASFDEILKQAQEKGYAEADPAFDVEGVDAVHKISILASIAFGIPLQSIENIYRGGIGEITYEDICYAEELGYRIKPLAIAKHAEQGIEVRVHPSLVPHQRLLAKVDGVMNAVLVTGDAVGRTLYYGAGAGSEPTASAVVADLVDVVRASKTEPDGRVPPLAFRPGPASSCPMLPMSKVVSANYLRMHAINQAGVLADVTKILGNHEISIESIIQKSSGVHEDVVPVVIVTQETQEEHIAAAVEQIEDLNTVVGRIIRIRINELS